MSNKEKYLNAHLKPLNQKRGLVDSNKVRDSLNSYFKDESYGNISQEVIRFRKAIEDQFSNRKKNTALPKNSAKD